MKMRGCDKLRERKINRRFTQINTDKKKKELTGMKEIDKDKKNNQISFTPFILVNLSASICVHLRFQNFSLPR